MTTEDAVLEVEVRGLVDGEVEIVTLRGKLEPMLIILEGISPNKIKAITRKDKQEV